MHSNIWRDEDLYRNVEEDNIYEDPDRAIYRVSSNDDVYCIISSDHMTSVSKLNSLYNILVKFI
jgi:hypothetical protein